MTASGLTDINFACDPDYERNIFKTAAEVEEPLHFEPRPAGEVYYPGCYSSYIHKTMVLAVAPSDGEGRDGLLRAGRPGPLLRPGRSRHQEPGGHQGQRTQGDLQTEGDGSQEGGGLLPGLLHVALSKAYPGMFGPLGFEVVQASQFLGDTSTRAGWRQGTRPAEGSTTDPCHLTRGAGIFKEPRELLREGPWNGAHEP